MADSLDFRTGAGTADNLSFRSHDSDRPRSPQRLSLRDSSRAVEILECTLRDGSYAVDFKFTENDTSALAGVLGQLGFHWIEVGHGLGLGAAVAGKGSMPVADEKMIEAAKAAAPNSRIGCFFIPGIGKANQLKDAHGAGLDFIRIGCNASEIEEAFPFVEQAKSLGLVTCLNFMKTYGVSPKSFGEKAKAGADAGADIIYCVDSAGSMFPEDVRNYFEAARERCLSELGFHGHTNLQFATANSVEAVRSGATFIDTTLYGLGRSAGNVPTEVAVAVFQNLGIATGINLFDVMDAAEEFISPLMAQMQLYDMISVAMGGSQFHSSFLPKVAEAARKHGVDLRRLVFAMGKLDPVRLDESNLNRVAAHLPKTKSKKRTETLTSFSAPGISAHSISSSLAAVQSLIDGMIVACAKRRARPVLELVASESHSPDLVLADLILAEGPVVLGRVIYGSFDLLQQVLRLTGTRVSLFLNDKDGGAWGRDWPNDLKQIVGEERILAVRSQRLFGEYLEQIVLAAAERYGEFCLMIYGSPGGKLLNACCECFRNVVVRGELPSSPPQNCWQMTDFSDRMHFDLGVTVVLLLCPPDPSDSASIDQLLSPDGLFITAGHFPRFETDLRGRTLVRVDANQAYRGQLDRWAAISNLIKFVEPIRVAAS
jgi:4-hydroxy-2-oxovalerate aldolase